MDIKTQKGGDNSVNIQGNSVNIYLLEQETSLTKTIVDTELSKINDILYNGRPNQWKSTLERVKNLLRAEQLSPAVLLSLVSTCAIGRVRKEIDTTLPLLFTDTSWITHSESFWNDEPQMQRWLNALGEVASERSRKNLKTYRVFFWDSAIIVNIQQLHQISHTIISHLNFGILVVLLDIQAGYNPIDVHVYTKKDGLYSNEFSSFNINELKDPDSIYEYLRYVPGFCEKLPSDGSALFFSQQDSIKSIVDVMLTRCPNLEQG